MSMDKETILIIGAGINQVPIIRTAKKLGYYVIAVSPDGDYPGLHIADEVFREDILNRDSIVEFARKKKINGVISDQSDIATPTVAYIAEQLGLPGFGYENALCFTNKTRMRDIYIRIGLPVAPNQQVGCLGEAIRAAQEIGYPIVIKPEDCYSSRGVFRVDSDKELTEKFNIPMSVSRSKKVLVEKYIAGPQYFSQGFVDDYKLNMFAFSDRYYFNIPDLFLPYTNAFPTKADDSLKQRMADSFEKVIDYLKPRFGQVWGEWIYDEANDTLYMVEMAIRGAGAFVTTDVIPRAYGIDTQPYLIESAMGHGPVHFSTRGQTDRAAAFYCFLLPPGTVTFVEGLEQLEKIKGVVKTNLSPIHVGDIIEPWIDKTSRFGPIIVEGETRSELDAIRDRMIQTLDIRVMTLNGEKSIVWE